MLLLLPPGAEICLMLACAAELDEVDVVEDDEEDEEVDVVCFAPAFSLQERCASTVSSKPALHPVCAVVCCDPAEVLRPFDFASPPALTAPDIFLCPATTHSAPFPVLSSPRTSAEVAADFAAAPLPLLLARPAECPFRSRWPCQSRPP